MRRINLVGTVERGRPAAVSPWVAGASAGSLAPTGDRGARGAARFSTTWDPHRLWLTAMEEEGDRLTIRGEGLSVGDVGELLSRLQVSVYFRDVRLERTEQVTAGDNAQRVQRFTLVARL